MNNQSEVAITVIIPIYKTPQKLFENCLKSLACQTLKNVEFLMIFDGTNKGLEITCLEFQKKDSRFKIFKQKQSGVSAARNLGISKAIGKYITFVDADDALYSKETLKISFQESKKLDSDIILFDWSLGDNNEKKLWNQNKAILSNEERENCIKQFIHIQNAAFIGAPWAKLYKRIFLLKNKIYFIKTCSFGEDRIFNYNVFSLTSNISYINLTFYKYIVNKKSATQRFFPNYLSVTLNYIEELVSLSRGKYSSLIGREVLTLFYQSWEKDYMNPQNKKNFFSRIKQLINEVTSNRFQSLIKNVDTKGSSLLFKIETILLQHKITFWIYIHGFKRLYL